MQHQPAPPVPGAMPAPAPRGRGFAPAEQPQEQASPEEQSAYDQFMDKARTLIFDRDAQVVRPAILEGLQGEDPAEALAETAAVVFSRVDEVARQAGAALPESALMEAGKDVFELLAQVATLIGTADFMADDDLFNRSFLLAVDKVRGMGAGPQEAAQEDFAQMVEMDKSGELAALMGQM